MQEGVEKRELKTPMQKLTCKCSNDLRKKM
jgi:hypothetical protein